VKSDNPIAHTAEPSGTTNRQIPSWPCRERSEAFQTVAGVSASVPISGAAMRVFASDVASRDEGEAMNRDQNQVSHRADPRRPARCVEDSWSAAVCSAALLLALTAIAALVASLL
jgi:hypothetical protein